MYTKYYFMMSRRTLVTSVFSVRRRDTFKRFSILQILHRRRRSTGVHPCRGSVSFILYPQVAIL